MSEGQSRGLVHASVTAIEESGLRLSAQGRERGVERAGRPRAGTSRTSSAGALASAGNVIPLLSEGTRSTVAADGSAAAAAFAVLGRLRIGVIVVRPDGEIVFASQRAELALNANRGVAASRGRLQLNHAETNARLRRHIRLACASRAGGVPADVAQGYIPVPSHEGRPMVLVVTPFPADSIDPTQAMCLVVISEGCDVGTTPEAALRSLYGLTLAEARLANAISAGARLETLAAQWSVSINTLRTQLRSVFGKTGTERQSELVRLLLADPLLRSRDPDAM